MPDKIPEIVIPQTIRLPNGTEYSVRDLLSQQRNNVEYHNLQARGATAPRPRPRPKHKYEYEDHEWHSKSTLEEIMKRRGITYASAKLLQWKSRKVTRWYTMMAQPERAQKDS